jgi:tetratricopeptide (TPR) repeat protein
LRISLKTRSLPLVNRFYYYRQTQVIIISSETETTAETVTAESPKPISPKKKGNWFNWFVPLLLIVAALATLFLYPDPEPVKKTTSQPSTPTTKAFSANDLALKLVASYFNGSDEDKIEQINALENTINYLKTNHSKKAFTSLKNNNLGSTIQSLVASSKKQKPIESAKTWIHIGNIQNLTSTKQALQAYKEASIKDPDNSNAWNRQGHVYRQLKQFDKAESAYRKVKAIDSKSTTNQAEYLASLASLSQSKGKIKEAEKSFLEALKIYTTFENNEGIISTSESLAGIYKATKKYPKAETYYLTALAAHQKNEQTKEAVTTYSSLGDLYQMMNRPSDAQSQYESALEISLNNNFEESISPIYNKLGQLAEENGDLELSKNYFDKALLLDNGIEGGEKRSITIADQLANLAIENRKKKQFAAAEEAHLKAIEIYKENNHTNGINSQKINLGFLYKVWNKPQKACAIWKSGIALLQRSKNSRLGSVQQLIRTNCR